MELEPCGEERAAGTSSCLILLAWAWGNSFVSMVGDQGRRFFRPRLFLLALQISSELLTKHAIARPLIRIISGSDKFAAFPPTPPPPAGLKNTTPKPRPAKFIIHRIFFPKKNGDPMAAVFGLNTKLLYFLSFTSSWGISGASPPAPLLWGGACCSPDVEEYIS